MSGTSDAEILGVDQPKVSALVTGRLAGFSFVSDPGQNSSTYI